MDFSDYDEKELPNAIASYIESVGTAALGNITSTLEPRENGQRIGCRYTDATGRTSFILVGELAHAEEGTATAAHGDFLEDHTLTTKISDSARVRDIYALRAPTGQYQSLAPVYRRQTAVLNEVRLRALARDELENNITITEDWTSASVKATASSFPDEIISVRSKIKFKIPKDITQREHTCRILRASFLEDVENKTKKLPKLSLQIGQSYAAEVLPDFSENVFALVKSRVIQQDVRDISHDIIPPWQSSFFFRAGAIVILEGPAYHMSNVANGTCTILMDMRRRQ
ncbi:hypothetical protein BDN72DRAFT_860490 [Pluteus cervinus]|uniref:Uncharacterized protein n=1 Tax=Pluteus cervinus TaxID=181527 RepID=A0ACD3AJL9_9AGAR|nr:hypothetical protein BDN72DRAFT_860490 [Pluteus cervinus]